MMERLDSKVVLYEFMYGELVKPRIYVKVNNGQLRKLNQFDVIT